MRKFIYTCVITLGAMLISSCIDTPKIESIRFIDDEPLNMKMNFLWVWEITVIAATT